MANAKKDTTTKSNNSSLSSVHPPYLQMISEAITTMKDRSGSSQPSIAKFMEENYRKQLPPNFKKNLSIQLKRFVKSEKLVKVKNSYKISAAVKVKKTSEPVQKRQAAKKEAAEITYTEAVEKSKKTKRLSQVKTPEGLKKKTAAKTGPAAGENPMKRKKAGSSPPAKKAKN